MKKKRGRKETNRERRDKRNIKHRMKDREGESRKRLEERNVRKREVERKKNR